MNINLTLPQSWENLTPTQLKRLATLLITMPSKSIATKKTQIAFDLGVLLILLNIKWWQFKKINSARKLVKNYRFQDIKKHYNFIYTKTNLKNFIPSIVLNKTLYTGPAPFMLSVTAYEFSVADDMYLRFSNETNPDKKIEYAQYLSAVLYKPSNAPEFNIVNLEAMREPFKKAPQDFLHACALSYTGCRVQLEGRYKRVFPKAPAGIKTKAKSKKYGFGKILLQMAGGKFGTHEETKRTPLHTFLEQLNEDLTPKKPKR